MRRRAASGAASMAARRSRASRSISRSISTASRWRSTSRRRTGMGRGNAVRRYSKGMVPVLHQLAGGGFQGTALGDLSYRGERLSKAGEALGITLQPSAGGHGGTFIPEGIRVERSLGWISRYRRLNTIFERGHLVAFIEIAFISILSRRLVRLVTQEISAWRLQTDSECFAHLKAHLEFVRDNSGQLFKHG